MEEDQKALIISPKVLSRTFSAMWVILLATE